MKIEYCKMDASLYWLLENNGLGADKYRHAFGDYNINTIADLLATNTTTWEDPVFDGIIGIIQKRMLQNIIKQLKQ